MDVKKLFTKILTAISPQQTNSIPYTTGAANVWARSGNFTISQAGLYRIRASHSNSPVLGIGYSSTTASQISQAFILEENQTGGSIDVVAYLTPGTYSLWTKCSTPSRQNTVVLWKVLVP